MSTRGHLHPIPSRGRSTGTSHLDITSWLHVRCCKSFLSVLVPQEALLREMDKKRQRLVAEAAELERMMAALRGADPADMPDPELLQQKLPDLNLNLHLGSGLNLNAAQGQGGGWGGGGGGGQQGDAGGAGGGGLAGSVTMGLQALQFRTSGSGGEAAAGGGGRGGGRPPGMKRPREDASGVGGSPGGGGGGPSEPKNVIMVSGWVTLWRAGVATSPERPGR